MEDGRDIDMELIDLLEGRAARWFRHGAERGDPGCMVRLASWLVEGRESVGGVPDKAVALCWYYRSWSINGNMEAAEGIGLLYATGEGDEDDDGEEDYNDVGEEEFGDLAGPPKLSRQKSVRNSQKSENNTSATDKKIRWDKVGPYTMSGKPVPKNLPLAVKFCARAAYKGSVKAESVLGTLLIRGGPGLKQDIDQGMYHLHRAAMAGTIPWAMRKYGQALLAGYGTRKEDANAGETWIARAAAAHAMMHNDSPITVREDVADIVHNYDSNGSTEQSPVHINEILKAVENASDNVEYDPKNSTLPYPGTAKVAFPSLGAPEDFNIPDKKKECTIQ